MTSPSHLAELAREPRPAGSAAEGRARDHAARLLRDAGFTVHEEPFGYSALPGRWGTPIGGVLAGTTVVVAALTALLDARRWHAAAALGVGLTLLVMFIRLMLGDAVLDLPWARARSVNLVATRGDACPRTWLVAHLDSKSQPIPSAMRVAGIALLASSIVVAVAAAALQLAGAPGRTAWWVALLLALAGAPVVASSTVGSDSDGAVDNASGVATVLLAAERVGPRTPVGVLLPSAEELGLAGARAWARAWMATTVPGVALNCDGVDDEGTLTIMYSGRPDDALLRTLRRAAPAGLRVRRMPLGLLTDSVALAERGWRSVTVSRGGWGTLRRVHSRRDSLANLTGGGIYDAATLLARAVEALD